MDVTLIGNSPAVLTAGILLISKARSFGLRGLRERADTVGGWVDVSSGATGTTVILSVPLPSYRRTGRDSQMSAADVVGVREDERHNPSAWGDL